MALTCNTDTKNIKYQFLEAQKSIVKLRKTESDKQSKHFFCLISLYLTVTAVIPTLFPHFFCSVIPTSSYTFTNPPKLGTLFTYERRVPGL